MAPRQLRTAAKHHGVTVPFPPCLLHAPFPRGKQATSHEPFRQLGSGLKIPEVFTEMISTQFKEGEHKRDWALWVLVGPDNNSVGMGLVCRQQLYHVSLKDGKGSHSAWLSWRNLEVSTLSFCTREQRWKRDLCAGLMDQALVLVDALTLEEARERPGQFSCTSVVFALSPTVREPLHMCITEPRGLEEGLEPSLKGRYSAFPSSFGQVIQSCCVLRETGSELVFLKASGCNLQISLAAPIPMQQAQGRELEVPCGSWCKAALPSHLCGDTGRCPIGTPGVCRHQGQLCCCVQGCAGVSACRKHGYCFNDVSLGPAVYPDRRGQSSACTHVRGLLVLHTPPRVSVQPPQCAQHVPKGSSCPVLHIIGLTGLFSGTLSVCQGKGLSRHGVKPTSFKSHSALGVITSPGGALSIKHFP